MLFTLYNIYTKKSDIIKKYIEEQRDIYLENIYEMQNLFHISFYEQCVESTIADAYEFFVETENKSNFFYENIKLMNEERGKRFFKLMAIHHTIKILRENRMEIDTLKMKKALFSSFEFSEEEQKLYHILYLCACDFERNFSALFAKTIAKYLFSKDSLTPFSLAFLQNFCYNSYKNFMQSFTKYISLSMRLQRAAN